MAINSMWIEDLKVKAYKTFKRSITANLHDPKLTDDSSNNIAKKKSDELAFIKIKNFGSGKKTPTTPERDKLHRG